MFAFGFTLVHVLPFVLLHVLILIRCDCRSFATPVTHVCCVYVPPRSAFDCTFPGYVACALVTLFRCTALPRFTGFVLRYYRSLILLRCAAFDCTRTPVVLILCTLPVVTGYCRLQLITVTFAVVAVVPTLRYVRCCRIVSTPLFAPRCTDLFPGLIFVSFALRALISFPFPVLRCVLRLVDFVDFGF